MTNVKFQLVYIFINLFVPLFNNDINLYYQSVTQLTPIFTIAHAKIFFYSGFITRSYSLLAHYYYYYASFD